MEDLTHDGNDLESQSNTPADGSADKADPAFPEITFEECRALGCLLEKEMSTPENYPLTLKALMAACNQRSNRDPVSQHSRDEVKHSLQNLMDKGMASKIRVTGSRVAKYGHEISTALDILPREAAVLAELMLRGAQTPGELKQRASRMTAFDDLEDVHDTLESLLEQGFVTRHERMPGQKERRYAQMLGAPVVTQASTDEPDLPVSPASLSPAVTTGEDSTGLQGRVDALEREVRSLRQGIEALRRKMG